MPQDYSVPTRINGRTSDRGAMLDIEYFSPDRDRTDVVYNELRGQVKNWRFYSIERVENQIEVYLNYNRN